VTVGRVCELSRATNSNANSMSRIGGRDIIRANLGREFGGVSGNDLRTGERLAKYRYSSDGTTVIDDDIG